MSQQTYSREDYDKIKLNLPFIVEANEGMKKGVLGSVQIAKDSGAPNYIKSAEALESVLNKLNKAVDEATEITLKVQDKYRVMDEAGLLA